MEKDYEFKDWTQIKVTAKTELLDNITAVMSMVDSNLMIEDFSDIDLKTCYGDLIDESILNADKTVVSVSLFLPIEKSYTDCIAFIKDRFSAENIDARVEVIGVNEEDWANSWKAYYHPIRIGERIVIVPMWEDYAEQDGDIIVRMDPGMAFGTGTHETTKLVIAFLEKYVKDADRVLDVGCGSGILAICASKLGAGECFACDIDPIAVRVARENVEQSGQKNVHCEVSDLLRDVDMSGGQYDVITANIVADIIIRMAPDVGAYLKDDGILFASGIIVERAEEVIESLNKNGFDVVERIDDNGWCALALKKSVK